MFAFGLGFLFWLITWVPVCFVVLVFDLFVLQMFCFLLALLGFNLLICLCLVCWIWLLCFLVCVFNFGGFVMILLA